MFSVYRFGNCVPFKIRERGTPCDDFYTPEVDHVYISDRRTGGNIDKYLDFIELSDVIIDTIPDKCVYIALKVLCHYYLPPCGNSTFFEPPTSVCMEPCNHLAEICPLEWERLVAFFEHEDISLKKNGLTLINCSNTGEYLDLPHCCSDVGVDIGKFSGVRVLYVQSNIPL